MLSYIYIYIIYIIYIYIILYIICYIHKKAVFILIIIARYILPYRNGKKGRAPPKNPKIAKKGARAPEKPENCEKWPTLQLQSVWSSETMTFPDILGRGHPSPRNHHYQRSPSIFSINNHPSSSTIIIFLSIKPDMYIHI